MLVSNFSLRLLIAMFLTVSVSGADETLPEFIAGSGTSGGGHAAGPRQSLFDFYEEEGTSVLNPLTVPGIAAIMSEIEFKIPGFAKDLEPVFKKNWYLDSKTIDPKCPGALTLIVAKKLTAIACQNDVEIRISQQWYDGLTDKGVSLNWTPQELELNKRGVVFHEILRNRVLRGKANEQGLTTLVRAFANNKTPMDEDSMQRLVSNNGFGNYSRGSYVRVALKNLDDALKRWESINASLNAIIQPIKPDYLAFYKSSLDYQNSVLENLGRLYKRGTELLANMPNASGLKPKMKSYANFTKMEPLFEEVASNLYLMTDSKYYFSYEGTDSKILQTAVAERKALVYITEEY